ncbi:hypothetical protein AVEN_268171-1 [Araneus ventricosus]|uniref:Tc1-like transposase DDE domain-containing protein n=1 Tax=Araneus ventricosus TaxID=182803 RepID=A0A4Y2M632_ARAVE|nr:hypothetical protein AVEN_268171-1 [Araneus ventricosus]
MKARAKLCRAASIKEDCSHYDLLFVCLCPQRSSECGWRLHWAREHRSWTPEQWGHLLFTDESRFNIQNDSRRAMICREPGTRYRAPNIVERDNYRDSGLLVWEGIATKGRTDLYVFARGIDHALDALLQKIELYRNKKNSHICSLYRYQGYI